MIATEAESDMTQVSAFVERITNASILGLLACRYAYLSIPPCKGARGTATAAGTAAAGRTTRVHVSVADVLCERKRREEDTAA